MEERNACVQCGFTTQNFADFLAHVDTHEAEINVTNSESSAIKVEVDTRKADEGEVKDGADTCLGESPKSARSATEQSTKANSKKRNRSRPSRKSLHSCPHCNFTTFMSQHMKSHIEAHMRHEGSMYQCDVCQMQFSQKANMHRHRMRHSGVKPFQCKHCDKRFFRKDQMQEHSMTHIKEGIEFDCPVSGCALLFSQHPMLKTHLDQVHLVGAESPAACKRCSLTFVNTRRLLLHYQTKHDEDGLNGYSTSDGVQSPSIGSEVTASDKTLPNNGAVRITVETLGLNSASHSPASTESLPSSGTSKKRKRASPLAYRSTPDKDSLLNAFATQPHHYTGPFASLPMLRNNGSNMDSMLFNNIPMMIPNTNQPLAGERREDTDDLSTPQMDLSWLSPFHSSLSAMDNDNNGQGGHHQKIEPTSVNSNGVTNDDTASNSPSVVDDARSTCSAGKVASNHKECTDCGLIFLDHTLFLLHKGLHSDTHPWRCNLCGMDCMDKYRFHTHLISADHS